MPTGTKNAELIARLGHEFAKPSLLQDALTHPSLAGSRLRKKNSTTPYERLEFLGDRVLGLVIAKWLYELFPDSSEGDLAKRHASLGNRDALRAVALEIGLDRHLRLARGGEISAARKNLTALSDAMEALMGAMYLDGGLDVAERFIHRYWQKATVVEKTPDDPKTALQEWAQGQGLPLPQYKVVERSGPAHAPKFLIEVSVKRHPPAQAEGPSKRLAEKAAAKVLMQQLLAASKEK